MVPEVGAVIETLGGVVSAEITLTLVVALVVGSVTTSVPVAVPALTVMVAVDGDKTVCEVIEAPVPPESVKVGEPGVPLVHEVFVPVKVMLLPVVLWAILDELAESVDEMATVEDATKITLS